MVFASSGGKLRFHSGIGDGHGTREELPLGALQVQRRPEAEAFNFFVVLSVFADGGAFAAIEKQMPTGLVIVIGAFIMLLALAFFLIDKRSQYLTFLARDGLRDYEQQFPAHSRLFDLDEHRKWKFVRYTTAFYLLYGAQFLFGLAIALHGLF